VPREGKQIFLTHSQLDALADAAGRERLVILFLGYTGVRYGEMAALRMRNLECGNDLPQPLMAAQAGVITT
jgi:integrase